MYFNIARGVAESPIPTWWLLLAQAFITIFVAAFAAGIGLWAYHKRMDFDLIKERYLIGALDKASNDLCSELNIFWQNWSRCLFLLKKCRDVPNMVERDEFGTGFHESNTAHFNQGAYFRIYWLIRTDLLWTLTQTELAFLDDANKKVVHEIPDALRAKVEDQLERPWEEVVEECLDKLKQLEVKAHRYAEVSKALQLFAFEIERKPLRWASVRRYLENFHTRTTVVTALTELRGQFHTELASLEGE